MLGGRKSKLEQMLLELLRGQELAVVRKNGDSCQLLFATEPIRERMLDRADENCATGLSFCFPALCSKCPYGPDKTGKDTQSFEVRDGKDDIFSVHASSPTWLDGKPATSFSFSNITDIKKTESELYRLAYTDALTGLPNRLRLRTDFELMEDAIENGRCAGIMALLDLDFFKEVNDTYGHNAGDIMLKRLAEYITALEDFGGHMYRLGGDEFVLLLSDKPDRHPTQDAFLEHYNKLLSHVMVPYSIPNIDMSCTLSVGVSIFPQHGTIYSDLLRKADIALYKSKEDGRNTYTFFQDKYEVAKKFKDLYVNIEPILAEGGATYAYTLTDNDSQNEKKQDTVNLMELNRTLDMLGLIDMESNARYFIPFSSQLLNPAVLKNLPKDLFVIQLPASRLPEKNEMEFYQKLHAAGYHLALLGLRSPIAPPELMAIAEYCCFDPMDNDVATQKKLIDAYPKIFFIAADVNTQPQFHAAKRRGFRLFQGYFFNTPSVIKKTKEIDPLRANYLRLLQLTSTDNFVDFREISAIISTDVALSYKLLRLLNSAAVGLRNVTSISVAVTYLGEENLKKWIALLALRGVADRQPPELVRMSLIRARFGELLTPHLRVRRDAKHIFLVGLLSLLHVALEQTREEMLQEIPIADDIRESLLTKTGRHSDIVDFFEQYEYSNWDYVDRFAEENRLNPKLINELYISAIKWYNDLSKQGKS